MSLIVKDGLLAIQREVNEKIQRYLRIKQKYEDFVAGRASASESALDEEVGADAHETLQFAVEEHLRDFLARDLYLDRARTSCLFSRRTARHRVSGRCRAD